MIISVSGCGETGYDVREETVNESVYSTPSDIIPYTTDIEKDSAPTPYKTISWRNIKKSAYYTYVDNKYGYAALNDAKLRDLYDKTVSAMYSISNVPDEKGRYTIPQIRIKDAEISEQQIKLVMQAISVDYPYVFWLNNMFSYYYSSNDTLVQMYVVEDSISLQDRINEFSAAVSDIISQAGGGLSEYDREKFVNDYIIDNCEYDESAGSWRPMSVYGAVIDGKAICGGYAYAAQLLLNLLGIDATCVTGKGREELHVWNQVKIDGLWYNLDVTWNDGVMSRYDYFNLNDEVFYLTHTPCPPYTADSASSEEMFNAAVRPCTSTDANYYVKECVLIDNFTDELSMDCTARIAKSALSGEEYFSMIISPENDYDKTVNVLFYESPYMFFNYISEANKLCGDLLNSSELSVIKKDDLRVITVKLCYN